METRQEKLLTLVIENHIATAEPVGSKFLVAEGNLDWSEATVRNELRALEEEGYLTHPHTSAGRIPTSKGYRYYVDHLDFSEVSLSKQDEASLNEQFVQATEDIIRYKQLAKNLAEVSEGAVVLAFSPHVVYYTGLANLFQKPEFNEFGVVVDISSLFDHFEEVLGDFYNIVDSTPRYFIGEEHNLGGMLSVLATRCGKNQESLLALLGPQRMEYGKNFALLNKVLEIM
jgi:heat-inducible transcriptional repressor